MSTKYQRPSATYTGASGLNNRTKYQDDAAAVPKVAISSSKIDGDFNYIVDALNSIDTASGSRSSIADRLAVSLNDDGTLKVSATATLDDWVEHSVSNLSRTSDTSVAMDGDQSGVYAAGRRVRLTVSGSYLYASVSAVSFGGGITTLELSDVVDSNGANATVSTNPTRLDYGPLTAGSTGNTPQLYQQLVMEADGPLMRVRDNGVSGKEFAIRGDNGALEFLENTGTTASPTWALRASVTSTGLALSDDSVTLAKLAHGTAGKAIGYNGSGEPAEIDVVPADGSITTAKLADNGVTLAKLAHGTANKLLGFDGSGIPSEVDSPTPSTATTAAAGTLRYATSSNVTSEVGTDGGEPLATRPAELKYHPGVAKAWVRFNGNGTVAITDSYNVSSITDNGTGSYTVNFSFTWANANYACLVSTRSNLMAGASHTTSPTTTACRIESSVTGTGAAYDAELIHGAFYGDI